MRMPSILTAGRHILMEKRLSNALSLAVLNLANSIIVKDKATKDAY